MAGEEFLLASHPQASLLSKTVPQCSPDSSLYYTSPCNPAVFARGIRAAFAILFGYFICEVIYATTDYSMGRSLLAWRAFLGQRLLEGHPTEECVLEPMHGDAG